ncbi:hypothetical protein LUZ63_012981 [Rhynchospora breviuscula]|uniref:PGG domain-containing protein n=1 Tax=Rhynchospora breviuscula TaxID=2022672 RepID=A0A9Q0HJR9_9POAL|nr:hypothetical protein LUZ63_012981 [Rhynchospora breviuscula]
MSVVLENEGGRQVNIRDIFPDSSSIKVVRFTVGTTTVEIYSNGQDENCHGTSNAPNIGQYEAGITSMVLRPSPTQSQAEPSQRAGSRRSTPEEDQKKKEENNYINSMNGWLMTVATLLMNMAFTAGLNIPGGAWSSSSQFNSAATSNGNTDDPRHTAGRPIIMNIDRYRYYVLMAFDVIAFACSMSIIFLLLFKKSPEHRLFGIRNLLVYAMVMVAAVYVLGCAPYSGFIIFILAVGAPFIFIQLTFGPILWRWLRILWRHLRFLWRWLNLLWGNWEALLDRFWDQLWDLLWAKPETSAESNISGDARQQAAAHSATSEHGQC